MKIAVSACLLGQNCKYNGRNNHSQAVLDFIEGHTVIPVCPEVAGGLPIPRIPVELKDGKAINKNGEDVTAFFRRGVKKQWNGLHRSRLTLRFCSPAVPPVPARKFMTAPFPNGSSAEWECLHKPLPLRKFPCSMPMISKKTNKHKKSGTSYVL